MTRLALALLVALTRDPRPAALDRLSRRPRWIVRRIRAIGRDGRR